MEYFADYLEKLSNLLDMLYELFLWEPTPRSTGPDFTAAEFYDCHGVSLLSRKLTSSITASITLGTSMDSHETELWFVLQVIRRHEAKVATSRPPGLDPGEMLEYETVTVIYTPLASGEFWSDYDVDKNNPNGCSKRNHESTGDSASARAFLASLPS